MEYFVIEHDTKGMLFDFVSGEEFHFSSTAMRSDEKVDKFFSLPDAQRVFGLLPRHVSNKCTIRRSTERRREGQRLPEYWSVVWPKERT